MKRDKWWLTTEEQPNRDRDIRKRLVREIAGSLLGFPRLRVPRPAANFHAEIMLRKHHDHVASHSNRVNQVLHFFSSSSFILAYALLFANFSVAMWLGLWALIIRQAGHALIEPPCRDKERLLLGFDTPSKSIILGSYLLIPLWDLYATESASWANATSLALSVAQHWFILTAVVVFGRVFVLIGKHGLRDALVWFVKLITDPFTDVIAYYPSLKGRTVI